MAKALNLGAIDVGSNGVRIVVARSEESSSYKILEDIRVPIRLGEDAFNTGVISDIKENQLIASFATFKNLFDKYKVDDYMAVATSAFRDAKNKFKIVRDIHESSGIDLQIIDGFTEARLLQAGLNFNLKPQKFDFCIALDIGGGSCEFIASIGGDIIELFSLKLGTVRLLNRMSTPSDKNFHALTEYIDKAFSVMSDLKNAFSQEKSNRKMFVVTGGNARSLNKLARRHYKHEDRNQMSLLGLSEIIRDLKNLSYEQRIIQLNLKPDRADVILPASFIILKACQYFNTPIFATPRITLRDGLIAKLCHDLSGKHD